MKKIIVFLALLFSTSYSQLPITTANLPFYLASYPFSIINVDSISTADSSSIYIQGYLPTANIDTSNIGYLQQAETILGDWVNTAFPWGATEIVSTVIHESEINSESELEALSFQIWAEAEIDTSLISFRDQVETITGDWVNTAYPWADNEVANDITASNYILLTSVRDSIDIRIDSTYIDGKNFIPDLEFTNHKTSADHDGRYYTETESNTLLGAKADSGAVAYLAQDETIAGNWVNTTSPWAENELASTVIVESEINTFAELQAFSTDKVLINTADNVTIGSVYAFSDSLFADTLTTNISNLGTVKTGTWNGTEINDTYIPNDITLDSTKIDDHNFIPDAEFTTHKTSTDHDGRYYTETESNSNFQPLESTLTDIADGTIAENLVNTSHPWAEGEIASTVIVESEINTFAELQAFSVDKTLVNEEDDWDVTGVYSFSDSIFVDTLEVNIINGGALSGSNTGDDSGVDNVSTALSVGTNNTTVLAITSDGGADDVTIPVATTTVTGVMNSAMFDNYILNTNKVTDDDVDIMENGVSVSTDANYLTFLGTDFNLTDATTADSVAVVIEDSGIDHDATTNFVAEEHIRWDLTGTGTIHANNYVDNNTQLDSTGVDGLHFVPDLEFATHKTSSDHDGRYYTETEVGTWRSNVTQTEMSYVDGITSDIQTQINAKEGTLTNEAGLYSALSDVTKFAETDEAETFAENITFSKGIEVGEKIKSSGTEITVTAKNKYMQYLMNESDLPIFKHQTYYWNGSAYVATDGFFFGQSSGDNNTGSSSNGFGSYALRNNTGIYSNGFGSTALQNNAGSSSNGFGYSALRNNAGSASNGFGSDALYNNTGSYSNGFGSYALQYNTGSSSNGFGHYALRNNTGSSSNGFGFYALLNNTGPSSNGFGHSALQYNDGDNNTAIGDNAFNTFTEDTGNAKAADTVINATNRVVITGHGFGTGYINLKASTTGVMPTGLATSPVQWTIIDEDTLECKTDSFTDDGTGTLTLTPQFIYTNSTAIGYDAQPTASNQIVLGNANVTEVKIEGGLNVTGGTTFSGVVSVSDSAFVDTLEVNIINGGTLSGSNTGDQDLSGLLLKSAIPDTMANYISDVAYDATSWDANIDAATKNAVRDKIESLAGGHDGVTLNANATAGGLSLSTQEINFRAATNAQTGYATAAQITAIEANTAKNTNVNHADDDFISLDQIAEVAADDSLLIWDTSLNQYKKVDKASISAGAGTDDQTIDVFSEAGNTISISLEDDGEATKTLDISGIDAIALNTAKVTDTVPDSLAIDALNFVPDLEFATHKTSSDHDGRYYTETEVGTWRSNVTQTEMSYLDGVTSDIQTQFGAKADSGSVFYLAQDETVTGRNTFSDMTTFSDSLTDGTLTIASGVGTGFSSITSTEVVSDEVITRETRYTGRSVQKAYASFIYDDQSVTQYTVLKPLFDAKGIVGNLAVIANSSYGGTAMTRAQIQEMSDDGWEILSHCWTHAYLADSTDAVVRYEMSAGKDSLEARHGVEVRNFVYPNASNDEAVRRIAREYYRSAFARAAIAKKVFRQYMIPRVDIDDPTGLEAWKDSVDIAETDGRWIVFMAHVIESDDSTAQATLIDYIQAKGIPILTVDDALDSIGTMLTIGDNFSVGETGIRLSGDITIDDISGSSGTSDLTVDGAIQGTVYTSTVNNAATLLMRGAASKEIGFGVSSANVIGFTFAAAPNNIFPAGYIFRPTTGDGLVIDDSSNVDIPGDLSLGDDIFNNSGDINFTASDGDLGSMGITTADALAFTGFTGSVTSDLSFTAIEFFGTTNNVSNFSLKSTTGDVGIGLNASDQVGFAYGSGFPAGYIFRPTTGDGLVIDANSNVDIPGDLSLGDDIFNNSGDINFTASDGDLGSMGITTADALVFTGFGGGVDVDGNFTVGVMTSDGNVAGATYGSNSTISDAELLKIDDGATTEIIVGGGAGSALVWGDDLPTAVKIGSAYIYRVGGTDVANADVVEDLTIVSSTDVIGNSTKYYTEGGTSRNVRRSILLNITPGTTPGTDITVTLVGAGYNDNAPTVTTGTNIAATETDGMFTLDAGGSTIILDMTEAVIGVISCGWESDHQINNSSSEVYVPKVFYQSGNLHIRCRKIGNIEASWLAIMDAGDSVNLRIVFTTST